MSDITVGSEWRDKINCQLTVKVKVVDSRFVYGKSSLGCVYQEPISVFLANFEPASEFYKRQDKEGLKISPAMIRGIHPYSFRSGEWATIVGVVMCGKDYPGGRLNYMVMFDDGKVDYWPVCDESNHEIKAASEVSE